AGSAWCGTSRGKRTKARPRRSPGSSCASFAPCSPSTCRGAPGGGRSWAWLVCPTAGCAMATAEARPDAPRRTFRPGAAAAVNLVLAVALSAGVVVAARLLLPRRLAVSTDIVGYPTFFNFNIEKVVDLYYVVTVGFPLLTLLTYLALG